MIKKPYRTAAWIALYLMAFDVAASAGAAAGSPVGATRSSKESDGKTLVAPPERPTVPVGLDAPVDPDTYVIGPSDEFVFFVRTGERKEIRLVVLPEGTVVLPNGGPIMAAGLTITEFRSVLKEKLARFYRDVEFVCQLVIPRTFVVYVLGEVDAPGSIGMMAPFRLDAAIKLAGGISERGSSRAIEIRNQDGQVRTVDLLRFLRLGDMENNPALREGQRVFVPSRSASCRIIGEVWRAGNYEVLAGETVADIIDMAGGFTSQAAPDRVTLERFIADAAVSVTTVDEESMASTPVGDRDIIVVADRRSFEKVEYVRVDGGGGRSGLVPLQEGATLLSLVPRIGHLAKTFDLKRAVIEREAGNNQTELLDVDLEAIMDGTAPDIALEPNDVVSLPEKVDVVYVTGEVKLPGPIDFQQGLPARRYVALAGGATSSGGFDSIEIYAADGSRRKADGNSAVFRGETIVVKRRTSVVFGNVFVGLSTVTSLVLAVIAVTR